MPASRIPRPRPGSPGRSPLAWLLDGRPADVFSAPCPSRAALDRIADKWTVLIIVALSDGALRYGRLRQTIEGISEKMLTQTLRSLERDGLVQRTVHATTPPSVEYELTDLGRTLEAPLSAVRTWAEQYINDVESARAEYDRVGQPGDQAD